MAQELRHPKPAQRPPVPTFLVANKAENRRGRFQGKPEAEEPQARLSPRSRAWRAQRVGTMKKAALMALEPAKHMSRRAAARTGNVALSWLDATLMAALGARLQCGNYIHHAKGHPWRAVHT